eukprot:scaffold3804_cov197-Pinguiococcus_pyrenoidosus.AAC.3
MPWPARPPTKLRRCSSWLPSAGLAVHPPHDAVRARSAEVLGCRRAKRPSEDAGDAAEGRSWLRHARQDTMAGTISQPRASRLTDCLDELSDVRICWGFAVIPGASPDKNFGEMMSHARPSIAAISHGDGLTQLKFPEERSQDRIQGAPRKAKP